MSDRIEQIKARLAAATPGPWRWDGDIDTQEATLGHPDGSVLSASGMHTEGYIYIDRPDADLIANAPTDLACLLAENARLQGVIEAVRGDIHLTQMTPNPNDSGAYVLGSRAEKALLAASQQPTAETDEQIGESRG